VIMKGKEKKIVRQQEAKLGGPTRKKKKVPEKENEPCPERGPEKKAALMAYGEEGEKESSSLISRGSKGEGASDPC